MPFDQMDFGELRGAAPAQNRDHKARRGLRAYQSGLAAETTAEHHYVARGYEIVARRWRGASGEIDLILGQAGGYVMVEVKSAQRMHEASLRLGARQLTRVAAASQEFLAEMDLPWDTDMRIDLALVSSLGQIETLENVTLH